MSELNDCNHVIAFKLRRLKPELQRRQVAEAGATHFDRPSTAGVPMPSAPESDIV
jgi:hypothetical protein